MITHNNFSNLCIPDSDRVVIRARNDAFTVLRECDGVDLRGVFLERPYNNISSLCIPDSDCLVIQARNDALTVLRECDRVDRQVVSPKYTYGCRPTVCFACLQAQSLRVRI